jgi:hypothetical protein
VKWNLAGFQNERYAARPFRLPYIDEYRVTNRWNWSSEEANKNTICGRR